MYIIYFSPGTPPNFKQTLLEPITQCRHVAANQNVESDIRTSNT